MHPASVTREATIPSVGSEELAEGLMLVRASTLKIIRLQLAMERRDQRVALEAVDDLVALDRCLEEFLTHYPNPHEDGLLRNVLELERSALNVEKHTLAAGFSSASWRSETPATTEPAPTVAFDDAQDEWSPDESEPYAFETPRWWRAILAVLLVMALASGAYFLGASGEVPDWALEFL